MKTLRVGGIDYLNSLPLLWGLDDEVEPPAGDRGVDGLRLCLGNHVPSRLAAMLESGELDVALVPVVAVAEHPDWRVVPDISIASYGAVRSIRLYYRRPLAECRTVALDTCSRTSRLLTRLLFRDVWGGEPSFVDADPSELWPALSAPDPDAATFDAALLIGDAALRSGAFRHWDDIDLGTEWTRWTGLPFVYAVWACRGLEDDDPVARPLAKRLLRARDLGVGHIDDIVATARLPAGFSVVDARRYLHRTIRFELGDDELRGMALFFEHLRTAGLTDTAAFEPRFLPDC